MSTTSSTSHLFHVKHMRCGKPCHLGEFRCSAATWYLRSEPLDILCPRRDDVLGTSTVGRQAPRGGDQWVVHRDATPDLVDLPMFHVKHRRAAVPSPLERIWLSISLTQPPLAWNSTTIPMFHVKHRDRPHSSQEGRKRLFTLEHFED